MQYARKTTTFWLALAGGYVLAQLALTAWAGTRGPAVSYLFGVTAPLLALAACCRNASLSAPGVVRTGWGLFAAACFSGAWAWPFPPGKT